MIKFKVAVEVSEEEVIKIAEEFGVDKEEAIEELKNFQSELSDVDGIVAILHELDYFNY